MVGRVSLFLSTGAVAAGISAAALAGAGLASADDGSSAGAADNTSSSQSKVRAVDDSGPQDTPTTDSRASAHGADQSGGIDGDKNGGGLDIDPQGPAHDEDAEDSLDDQDLGDEGQGGGDLDSGGLDDGELDEDPPIQDDESAVDSPEADTALDGLDDDPATGEPTPVGAVDDSVEENPPTIQTTAPAASSDTAVPSAKDEPTPASRTAAPSAMTATSATEEAPRPATPASAADLGDTAKPADAAPKSTSTNTSTASTTFAVATPVLSAPSRPTLLNVVGTLLFSVAEAVIKLFEGPPAVPAGSTVTPGRSDLYIDCGDGYTVQADWYFPEDPDPERLIYFQHGWPARASFYNATAAELAERNNAIVVAPSISGNFFACDGCFAGGDAMHAAVAKLFLDDREALLTSARLASGDETLTLPDQFVIAGHSAGGQLAAGVGGFYTQYAPDERDHDLVGVLLLDTSTVGGAVSRGVAKIPDDIPVYTISAEPAQLNSFGDLNTALVKLRPDQFVGVELVGGLHADAFRSINPIAQFIASLMTGFSQPRNVEAVQVLAHGWIDDWFEGTHTDAYYGPLGSTIDIETSAGTAEARVLPTPPVQLNLIARILNMFSKPLSGLKFDNCAEDPNASSPESGQAAHATRGACGRTDA